MAVRSSAPLLAAAILPLALLSPSVLGLGEANVAITTTAGDFTPSTPVTTELEVSATVNNIITELSDGQFTAARQIYENSNTTLKVPDLISLIDACLLVFHNYHCDLETDTPTVLRCMSGRV
jgi:hypothetical protein